MDFWNTVLGQRLAETLNSCLPKLVKEKEQFTAHCSDCDIKRIIDANLDRGAKVVSIINTQNNGTIIVFEKKN